MKFTKKTLSVLCAIVMVLQLFAGLTLASAEEAQVWKLADKIEVGKTYIIVADGAYALSNVVKENLGNYSNNIKNSLSAAKVTIEGDKITSSVTDDMKWTFADTTGA